MTDKKWDDSKIDSLLRNMPDIQDERLQSDILVRLKQDERLYSPRRKMSKRWVPALVAVAALLVLSLLIPSMLQQNDSAMDDRVNESADSVNIQAKMSIDNALDNTKEESAEVTSDTREVKAFSAPEIGHAPTIEAALLEMKEVPKGILYTVQEREEVAVITFTEPLDLSRLNQDEVSAMLEGFILTAKNFNMQVRLENVMQSTFLHYDLTTVLPE
ncbi:hypothetical protein [Sporosarcina beigongshangi]|uniref:hypothetical protein n=1 Tax=Sporosarcina beigongshangi TaxID=2782538 RepID=UPI0019395E97|nr:hypothetical protein [Sporosarcina beigongshangi]